MNQIVIIEVIMASTGTDKTIVEAFATFAYPTYLSGSDTGHKCVIWDIVGHDSTCGDEGAFTDGVATDDGAVGAERCTFFN